jgi:hypothetical protein
MFDFVEQSNGSKLLHAKAIRDLVNYCPHKGDLWWKPRTPSMFCASGRYLLKTPDEMCKLWNARFADRPAFTALAKNGYRVGAILNRQYKAHRVAFAFMRGFWPAAIDHINGDRSDNKWSNLRCATMSQNSSNRVSGRNHKTSRYKGVSAREGRWLARCQGKDLGLFDNEEDAAICYNSQAFKVWGEYAFMNMVEK